ncbi:hypothetical protein G9A89_009702 [Geosiphon pyriformis]|nr:hypothetical protein G9A89_009702 [Geosiphon pyriformis]
MELASPVADGSGSTSRINSVYSCSVSYKKPKNPKVDVRVVDLSAGLLDLTDIDNANGKFSKSWGSEMENKTNSVDSLLDLKNIKNIVIEKTSYADLDTSMIDDMEDDTTFRKTCICTYMLGQSLKASLFDVLSDNDNMMALPSSKFTGFKKLHSVESCASGKHIFDPVKLFALDIRISVLSDKTIGNKLIAVKKIFYQVNSFGGASAPSKLLDIIKSSFTSELSLIKAKKMAISKKILVNIDIRKPNSCSDWEVIVKEIPMDFPKLAIEPVFSKFDQVISIRMQLIGLWQKAVVEFKSSDSVLMGKDSVCVVLATLLYTLPIDMTVHDLSDLLDLYSGKTCFIGHNSGSYVCNRSGLSLACCAKCKQFGHISNVCSVGGNFGICHKWVMSFQDQIHLANIYKRKQALVTCSVSFGGKTWAQIAGSSSSHVALLGSSGTDLLLSAKPLVSTSNTFDDFGLADCMVSLKCSMELLSDQVSEILRKLSFVDLVLIMFLSSVLFSVVAAPLNSALCLDIVVDSVIVPSSLFLLVINNASFDLSISSSKVLTIKIGGLESEIMALEVSFGFISFFSISMSDLVWKIATCNVRRINNPAKQDNIITNKFDGVQVFILGLNSDLGVVIVINNFLAKHISKVSEVSGHLISIKLLFKNRLSVMILGLYADASFTVHFSQANAVNSLIVKATNKSTFIVLGDNFNKDGSRKCASFKKCFSLGLVNFLAGSSVAKMPMWENSRGAVKTINYIFVFLSLVNTILCCGVLNVSKHFNTNYCAVSVFIELGRLLDDEFKDATMANTIMFSNKFATSKKYSDLDTIWNTVHKVVFLLANNVFKKKWFKSYNKVFTKESSWFHKLEILVLRLTKASYDVSVIWVFIDSSANFDCIRFAFFNVRKSYCASKLAEESGIRSAIEKQMESFTVNKDHMICSVLKHPFQKVVLDHLVSDGSLIVDSVDVKDNVVLYNILNLWQCQYLLLNYVDNNAFSEVIKAISYEDLVHVVKDLPNGKAAGLSGITNKLWKHCNSSMLGMLLDFLNLCLVCKFLYEWKSVLTNTRLIALIKTAHKILFKLLFDRILLVCSVFDVLHSNNFFMFKGTTTQSPIFAISSVVEDALEKNRELWLVLQNILVQIKMCDYFIRFFGSIHNDHVNHVMTNFGLTNEYWVHNVKRQESLCRYCIDSRFVARSGRLETHDDLILFLAAGVFVDNTIWYILNIASEFFSINNISINNKKTVAISINRRVKEALLSISGLLISIAQRGKSHRYLEIYLSSKGLSKPSLAKAYSNVRFFVNLVLRKTILDKKFLYLVLAVLQPIAFHHLLLYGLKSFEQLQAECKLVFVLSFSNTSGILGHLFIHRSLDLQVLIRLRVNLVNNFLAGVIRIFLNCNVSLGNFSYMVFRFSGRTSMSLVLGNYLFYEVLHSLKRFGIAFIEQLCTKKGAQSLISSFWHMVSWLIFLLVKSLDVGSLDDILQIKQCLLTSNLNVIEVYMDGSLKNFGMQEMGCGVAVYFSDVDMSIGIRVNGLVSSTLVKLQVITLALKCVSSYNSVVVYSNSQAALNACVTESVLASPNFHNQC